MPVNPGDIIRVTAKMSYDGNALWNTYHVRCDSSVQVGDGQFGADVRSWLDDAYDYLVPFMADDVTFDTVEWYNITQASPLFIVTWPTQTVGGSTDAALPLQAAALVKFTSDTTKSQGRKYLGGFVENENLPGGEVSAALLTALANYAADLLAGFFTGDGAGVPGNWSELYDRFATWVGGTVDDFFRTQRRRVIGVGE